MQRKSSSVDSGIGRDATSTVTSGKLNRRDNASINYTILIFLVQVQNPAYCEYGTNERKINLLKTVHNHLCFYCH